MKKIGFLLFLFSMTIYAQESLSQLLKQFNSKHIPYIFVDSLQNKKEKFILLDARELKEYQVSHIKNSIFVGYTNFKLAETEKKLPNKNKKIVVYCSLGIRSEDIAWQLIKQGYANVYNLYGGIFEWKNKGYKVYDATGKETEKVHTFSNEWSKWLLKK